MPARKRILLLLACTVTLMTACKSDDEMPPPPDDDKPVAGSPAKTVEIDLQHSLAFKADRTISISNIVLVLQNSAAKNDSYGVTLTTSRKSLDGSRAIFGALESASSVEALLKDDLHFAAASILDPLGNGIFTTTTAYQPKFVSLKITSIKGDEAAGTISGEFYRFTILTPGSRPTVLKCDGAFNASVIRK